MNHVIIRTMVLVLVLACSSGASGPPADQRTILFTNAAVVAYQGGAVDSANSARWEVNVSVAAGSQQCVHFRLAQLGGDSTINIQTLYTGGMVVYGGFIHVETVPNWTWDGTTSSIAAGPC